MDQETADYIVSHFSSLLTPTEKLAFKHISSAIKLDLPSGTEGKETSVRMYQKRGWLTTDENALSLIEEGIDALNLRVATRIMEQSKEKVFLNYCPKCGKLTRTPAARQCRHCSYDWHP